ncbi:MAG: DNA-binding protein [Gemmatimonadales bacterium]|nr:MAG: DNA-binding protein [Gemmatimonadales bacterium]
MTRVEVNPQLLRWAVERSGRAAAVERKFPKLSQWLQGTSTPTLRQLEAFARATATPFGYLFLEEPPDEPLPIPHFRTVRDQLPHRPSPDLLETVYTLQRRQAWLREYLEGQEEEPLAFVRSASMQEAPQAVAARMREVLGLRPDWAQSYRTWTEALAELRSRMEDIGISVVVSGVVGNNTRRKLDPAEFRGFVLVDEYAPFVFVNGADGRAAQMFTLAHELAHVWLGSSAAFDLHRLQPAEDEIEQACNRLAAEFLLTEAEFRQAWPSAQRDAEPYQALARRFKVSELVVARRALDLRLISRDQFFEFYETYSADERRRAARQAGGGNFYATQSLRLGRRFAETIVRAAKEGKVSYGEAYRLTGLYGRAFQRYAEALGLGGPE